MQNSGFHGNIKAKNPQVFPFKDQLKNLSKLIGPVFDTWHVAWCGRTTKKFVQIGTLGLKMVLLQRSSITHYLSYNSKE